MVYVTVFFSRSCVQETHEFHDPKTALRFMYSMRGKNNQIICYSCDDPFDTDWINRRFKL